MKRDLLSRKAYRQVIKRLEKYRIQAMEDAKEAHPIPLGFGLPLRMMIEDVIRNSPEDRFSHRLPDLVLEYLVEKKILARCLGDYVFPRKESESR